MIGRVHARSARLAGAEIAGVCASTPQRSSAVARQWGVAVGYPSALDAARDPDVDVVHVCTPNALHHQITSAALAAGKHVICEKPLARTAEALGKLRREAPPGSSGTVEPPASEARELLQRLFRMLGQ